MGLKFRLFTLLFIIYSSSSFSLGALPGEAIKLVDSSTSGFNYAYAPTIIKHEDLYYAYYCTTGTGPWNWDHLTYSTSKDLKKWSQPKLIFKSTLKERAACDPSIVKYDQGDGEYFYLFFSGNMRNIQTVNFVARSKSPRGPFKKLTERGTWEIQPRDSKVIIAPKYSYPEGTAHYGAGQMSVVVHNDQLYAWYYDSTRDDPGTIYLTQAKQVDSWSEPTATNVYSNSIDVKYDKENSQFIMFAVGRWHSKNALLEARVSKDGEFWSTPNIIEQKSNISWIHNVGVSGDILGHIDGGETLVSFGAPYDLSTKYISNQCKKRKKRWYRRESPEDAARSPKPYCWGYWDIFGVMMSNKSLDLSPSFPDLCTPEEYLEKRKDVAAAQADPIKHYLEHGIYENMCQPF